MLLFTNENHTGTSAEALIRYLLAKVRKDSETDKKTDKKKESLFSISSKNRLFVFKNEAFMNLHRLFVKLYGMTQVYCHTFLKKRTLDFYPELFMERIQDE